MTDLPPMSPSAEVRAGKALTRWDGDMGRVPPRLTTEFIAEIQAAYCDGVKGAQAEACPNCKQYQEIGAKAERDRLRAALREPSDELLLAFANAYHRGGLVAKPATAALRAVADKLGGER